ncbi:hypothetical protein AVEN_119214-1 [Araneus ventricosus]|uniref:Uncharacterized protein n=1 Tax=Araneus ventricosus TaxID=182803 RepID=A0A4Y2NWM8_ARAVE|nr:hypothetical protein AVEN_119214-1 [Araneus ventricosus]
MWQKHLAHENVWGAFGVHPKNAREYDSNIEKYLIAALNHPKVKASGEMVWIILTDPRFKRKGFISEKFHPAKAAVEKKTAGFNIPADKDGIVEETTNNNRKPEKRGKYFIGLWKDFREMLSQRMPMRQQ